jgi:putative Mn2+ efflux pump MntP
MDTFAVGICIGVGRDKICLKTAFIAGLYFGVFQAIMPLIGYFVGGIFSDKIINYGYWIAFVLLAFVGGKMIYEGFRSKPETNDHFSLSPRYMLPLAVATSLDALSVGVSFSLISVNIFVACIVIGTITLVISMIGVNFGRIFGSIYRSQALYLGGVILILIGIKILLPTI